ncbi:carotenoid biosynthesis protein [Geotalea sp. SG265]|uniref:carotenoid biosynthesis protein n=1 Tax=Geotalea sp. SG265 TaxID=2922867 RepID=UPI001FB0481F|nr:carotenoid biosynthesis protein [Geotalea sp. SG265]
MDDVLSIAVGTVTMRPYVFAFFAAFLVAAVPHLGWRKTLYFAAAGYGMSFLSEFCSINTGFPYGWYYYIEATKGKELWISGVPFFDSLSYVFLAYCSYTTALLVVSPIKACRGDIVTLETRSIRKSFPVLLLGSLFQVFLDIIIDPVALQGHRWFLGKIYGYREAGYHFGVPFSNYAGWFLVSMVMIFALQRIDARTGAPGKKPKGACALPFRSLYGPVLYLSVIVFNLTITFLIGERLMAMTGIFIFTLPIAISAVLIAHRANRYTDEELAEHLADYPHMGGCGAEGGAVLHRDA